MRNVLIRPVETEQDALDALYLMQEHHEQFSMFDAFDHNFTLAQVLAIANIDERKEANLFIARLNDETIGYIYGTVSHQMFSPKLRGCMNFLYVQKRYRSTSAGLRLLDGFVDWARALGAKYIEGGAFANEHEDAATINKFFDRVGFKLTGQHRIKYLTGVK